MFRDTLQLFVPLKGGETRPDKSVDGRTQENALNLQTAFFVR